jgi:hypothetical protein
MLIHLLAISGSLRAGASQTALLGAAGLVAPPGVGLQGTRSPGLECQPQYQPQYQPHHAGVAARLRGVCAAMPPNDFDRLVRDICAMKRRRESDDGPS